MATYSPASPIIQPVPIDQPVEAWHTWLRQIADGVNQLASWAYSPALIGNPTAPTPPPGDNDTSIATTAFVVTALGPYAPLAGNVTFSGNVTVNGGTILITAPAGTYAQFGLQKTNATDSCALFGQRGTIRRWECDLGNTSPETGSNAGSDYDISRWDDSGAYIGNALQIMRSNGACYNTGGTWGAISDGRVKKNVKEYHSGLREICALRPVSFEFNGRGGTENSAERYYGLVAQDVEKIMPELVSEVPVGRPQNFEPLYDDDIDIVKAVDPGRAIFACINSIRELADRIDKLEKRVI